MTRTDADSRPTTAKADGDERDLENTLTADSIFETLRGKLEAGQGECIYKLSDPCK